MVSIRLRFGKFDVIRFLNVYYLSVSMQHTMHKHCNNTKGLKLFCYLQNIKQFSTWFIAKALCTTWIYHPNYKIQLLMLISTIKGHLSDDSKSSFCFKVQYNSMTHLGHTLKSYRYKSSHWHSAQIAEDGSPRCLKKLKQYSCLLGLLPETQW